MKIFFRHIHLYLGLSAGLIILSCCFTGAILVFEKDIQMALNKKRYYVNADHSKLSIDELTKNVTDSFRGARINSIKIYEAANRSVEINVTIAARKDLKTEEQKSKAVPKAAKQPGYTIFIDPYTGKILEKYNYRETFFYKIFSLHRWLLGGEKSAGKYIVGIATLIFLFIQITGIILWWPKTKNILIHRLNIKWSAGWKRISHDLHIVLGFYSAIILFIVAFTALAWSFQWFNNGIYKITNSPLKNPTLPKSVYSAEAKSISLDQTLAEAKTVYPIADFYSITTPKNPSECIIVTALNKNAVHEVATDAVYIDQYSGTILGKLKYKDRSTGAIVRSTFRPIHTGSIGGTTTKILAFTVCLFGASFPITGVIMWINRTRRKSKKTEEKVSEEEVHTV